MAEGKREAALDRLLSRLFQALERRPTPDHIRSVVDQLEEPEKAPPRKTRGGRG